MIYPNPFGEEFEKYYIKNFDSDKVMLREIYEDILYVQLNLLLAIKIATYLDNSYIKDKRDFNLISLTKDIIKLIDAHKKYYSNAYQCLQNLREQDINSCNCEQLENILYAQDSDMDTFIENESIIKEIIK